MSDARNAATTQDLARLSDRVEQGFAQIFEFLEQFSAATAGYFQKIEIRLDRLEARVTGLETRMTSLEARMTSLEGRVRGLELRMDRLEARVGSLELCVQEFKGEVRGGFKDVGERLRRLEAA